MPLSMVTITKKTVVLYLFLVVSVTTKGVCTTTCHYYTEVENALVRGQHGERNLENMRAAFFPESTTAPLQVIVTYAINGTSQTWSWSNNLVYTLCGARYIAELGMGIPVISVLKMMGQSHLATPFLKVGNLALQLDNAPDRVDKEKCLTKLTSLLHQYALHRSNTSQVRIGSAVYGYPYDTQRELVVLDSGKKTYSFIVLAYCVILSLFLLPLLYHVIREYSKEVKQLVCKRGTMGYSIFWGVTLTMFASNTWHTVLYISRWRLESSHLYYVLKENTSIFLGLWWSILALCRLLAAALLPKDTSFPLPCMLYHPIRILCFGMKKERVSFLCQIFVLWCMFYFVDIQAQAMMFTAASILADPITASTWLMATLFLKLAAVAVLSSLFALERACNQDECVRAPLRKCIQEALHLLSWGTPFLGAFFLIGGISGLTLMDKEIQPQYVSSIASFLLAPTILTFIGLLSKVFINKLFVVTPNDGTFPDNNHGYTSLDTDDADT